jgi:hypothetical protein
MLYKECVEDYLKRGRYIKELKKLRKEKTSRYMVERGNNVLDKNLFKMKREIRKIEKDIRDLSRKNMHQHIALGLFKGVPLNRIISNNSHVKIRPESVWEFLTEITSWK